MRKFDIAAGSRIEWWEAMFMNDLNTLALRRAGFSSLESFQQAQGLPVTGQADRATQAALEPYLLGYRRVTLQRGDSFWSLAKRFGANPQAVATANPTYDPQRLPIGGTVTVPLPFPLVPTDVPMTSRLCSLCIQGLAARYPFGSRELLTTTAFGRQVEVLRFGRGPRRVIYSAAHHANEWITATVLLTFAEELAQAIAVGGTIGGYDADELARKATVYLVPMVDPDGVDLVTGALQPGDQEYEYARSLAQFYPNIPFPSGWKANGLGVDLNLNYPAGWETAREIKFSQGFTRPGPRDFVGQAPLDQRESRALATFTRRIDPALVLAYHSQGQVIYWQFQDIEVPGARELGERFAEVSGYTLEDTPYASSFAGYKDWFIQEFGRPGYTIEVGLGENPLPLQQFPEIYRDNLGILTLAMSPDA